MTPTELFSYMRTNQTNFDELFAVRLCYMSDVLVQTIILFYHVIIIIIIIMIYYYILALI